MECHLASDDKSQRECSEKCKSVDATVSTAEGLYTQSLFFVSTGLLIASTFGNFIFESSLVFLLWNYIRAHKAITLYLWSFYSK